MPYSTGLITTLADCDLLLAFANKEKASLNFKRLSEERQKDVYSENVLEIDAAMQTVDAEISATETIISSIPDGPTKDEAAKRLRRQEFRKFNLEDRKERYGGVSLVSKEVDLSRLSSELTEMDNFITEVNARKSAL